MDKKTRIFLIVAALAIAGYFAWRWYQNSSASSGSGGTGLGSNLNSVAPELVGGSSGPDTTTGPAVALPVNITLNETAPLASNGEVPMLGANNRVPSPLAMQSQAAANAPGIISDNEAFDAPPANMEINGSTRIHTPVTTNGGYQAPAASGRAVTAPHHPSSDNTEPRMTNKSRRTTNNPSEETTASPKGAQPLSQTRHDAEPRARRRTRRR